MQNLSIMLEDEPGALAAVAEALGQAGINIQGICGFPTPPGGTVHLLVDDASDAREAISSTGATVRDIREVLVLDLDNAPGELGRVTRRLADEMINLDLVYAATDTRLVLGVPNVGEARRALDKSDG